MSRLNRLVEQLGGSDEESVLEQRRHALRAAPTVSVEEQIAQANSAGAAKLQPAHVVVVGSGLAGLSATVEAVHHGAIVTLLEKNSFLGGNSSKATSGISAAGSHVQAEQGVSDSAAAFERDIKASGGPSVDSSLVSCLATQSTAALDWLEQFGIALSQLSQCGGHSQPRTHREEPEGQDAAPKPVGYDIVQTMLRYIETLPSDRLTVLTEATVLGLLTDESQDSSGRGGVKGVRFRDASGQMRELHANAVVLTAGGYAADRSDDSLLREYVPGLMGLATTNGAWASGDGIKMARAIGADVLDLDRVQVHPTSFVHPDRPNTLSKWLAPEALRGHGGIVVNQAGCRFVDELGLRDHVAESIFEHGFKLPGNSDGPTVALMVLNGDAVAQFGHGAFKFYAAKGFFREFVNADALCAAFELDATAFAATLAEYAKAAEAKQDAFGKTTFPTVFRTDEPLFVAIVTPSIHYTMGGLRINACCEVQEQSGGHLDTSRSVMGLFAAGECTGGVHGKNRLAGNSLLDCVVFGRIAGRRAAATNRGRLQVLDPKVFTPLPFREKFLVGRYVKIFRFDLPSSTQKLGLHAGQYISVRAKAGDKTIVRFYSPISRYDDYGHVDLLIKVDGGGAMSSFLDSLVPGDTLEFAGPFGELKLGLELSQPGQWHGSAAKDAQRFGQVKKIGLIAGGVGISPMVQILRSIFFHKRMDIDVVLLYGAMYEEDLVLKEQLEDFARHPNMSFFCALNEPPHFRREQYHHGNVDAEMIKKRMFAPADDVRIVVCGPYPMCRAMKVALRKLGYTDRMVYSYM